MSRTASGALSSSRLPYERWPNVAAGPNVTSGERPYRQGRDRPCAGLRCFRAANPASGQSLCLPSGFRGLTVAGTSADDDPSSRCRPSDSSSRGLRSAIPAVAARSATALRERLRTGVRFTWSPAAGTRAGTKRFDARPRGSQGSERLVLEPRISRTRPRQAASAHAGLTLWSSISAW